MAAEVKFEIRETIISVNDGDGAWNTELNLMSWNGREPKYDIRKWNSDHTKMGKGVSLSEDEAILFFQQADKFLDRFRTEPKQEDFKLSERLNTFTQTPPKPADSGDDFVLPFD